MLDSVQTGIVVLLLLLYPDRCDVALLPVAVALNLNLLCWILYLTVMYSQISIFGNTLLLDIKSNIGDLDLEQPLQAVMQRRNDQDKAARAEQQYQFEQNQALNQ